MIADLVREVIHAKLEELDSDIAFIFIVADGNKRICLTNAHADLALKMMSDVFSQIQKHPRS